MPPDVFTLGDLKDILLIGPRSTFLRIGWASSASEWEVRWRLTRRLEQTGTLGALRDTAKRWGLDGAALPALSSSLLDRVLVAVRLGQLVGFVLPTVEIAASYGADLEAGRAALMAVRPERLRTAAGPQAGGPKPATGFALLPLEQRLATIVDRSETYLPASGRGLYRDVYQPGVLTKTVAALSFWAKTQHGVTTPILSAVFWAGVTRSSTRRVVDITADLVEMLDLACKAKTDTDADGAARHLARLIVTAGAEDFVRIIQTVPDKIKGGGPVREVYVYPPIPPIIRPPQERPRREEEAPRSVDSPECGVLIALIDARVDELKQRHAEMLLDKEGLYSIRPLAKPPFGSWPGHIQQFGDKQRNLVKLIKIAKSKGCTISPEAEMWKTWPTPVRPAP